MRKHHSRYDGLDHEAFESEAREIVKRALAHQLPAQILRDAIMDVDEWADDLEAFELCIQAGNNPWRGRVHRPSGVAS